MVYTLLLFVFTTTKGKTIMRKKAVKTDVTPHANFPSQEQVEADIDAYIRSTPLWKAEHKNSAKGKVITDQARLVIDNLRRRCINTASGAQSYCPTAYSPTNGATTLTMQNAFNILYGKSFGFHFDTGVNSSAVLAVTTKEQLIGLLTNVNPLSNRYCTAGSPFIFGVVSANVKSSDLVVYIEEDSHLTRKDILKILKDYCSAQAAGVYICTVSCDADRELLAGTTIRVYITSSNDTEATVIVK